MSHHVLKPETSNFKLPRSDRAVVPSWLSDLPTQVAHRRAQPKPLRLLVFDPPPSVSVRVTAVRAPGHSRLAASPRRPIAASSEGGGMSVAIRPELPPAPRVQYESDLSIRRNR